MRLGTLTSRCVLAVMLGMFALPAVALDVDSLRLDQDNRSVHDLIDDPTGFSPHVAKTNRGYDDGVFWFRIVVTNGSTAPSHDWLRVENMGTRGVEAWSQAKDGSVAPLPLRYSRKVYPAVQLDLAPGELRTVYIKVIYCMEIATHFEVYTSDSLADLEFREQALIFMTFGICLGLLAYNLFVYLSVREKSHLYYVLYVICGIVTAIQVTGYGTLFMDQESATRLLLFMVCLTPALWGLFTRHFLATATHAPRCHKAIGVFAVASGFFALFTPFASLAPLNQATDIFVLTNCALGLVIAFSVARSGYRPAWFYLVSTLTLVVSALVLVLTVNGILPHNSATRNAFNTGFAIELAILALGLSDRLTMLRRQLVKALEEDNDLLEKRVASEMATINEKQAQIYASSRLASLGEMASGVSHEINNPLAIIVGNVNLMVQILTREEIDRERLTKMALKVMATAQRIEKITRSLLHFAREAENDPIVTVPVRKVIEDTIDFCRMRFENAGIRLEVAACAENVAIECRTTQLAQVLVHLINNAFDATLGTRDPWVSLVAHQEGDTLTIAVSDSGPGISPEQRDKLFHPFFTTKDVGKGTGLGLSISRGLVEANHGTLRYEGAAKHTTFVISIPQSAHQRKAA